MDPVAGARRLMAAKQYTTASYVLAIFEYSITLDREIDTFWQREFRFPTVLWFMNRYTFLCSLFPTLTGFFANLSETFPGAMQIISNIASGTTLSLRVYALYGRAWWVIVVLFPAFVAEIALESWAVDGGTFAILPPGQVGCILTGRQDEFRGIRFAAFWMGQLIFPTLIFVMTLIRALRLRRYGVLKGSILNVMLRDGIMYFLVIFIVNVANVITYIVAPEDLKFVNAPFTNVITTIMICRLMLNLRRASVPEPARTSISFFNAKGDDRARHTFLVGDLGEDMDVNNSNDRSRQQELREGIRFTSQWDSEREDPEFELHTITEEQYN